MNNWPLEQLLLQGKYELVIAACQNELDKDISKIYLGYSYYLLGKFETAKEYFKSQSHEIHKLDEHLMVLHHLTQAMIYTHMGYNKDALEVLIHARDEINSLMIQKQEISFILGNYFIAYGNYEWNYGNFNAAIHNYEEAIEVLCDKSEFRTIIAKIGLAESLRSIGNFKRSWELHLEVEEFARKNNNIPILLLSIVNRAISVFNAGDMDTSLDLIRRASAFFDEGNLIPPSLAYNLKGNIELLRGDLSESEKSYLLALDYRTQSGDIKSISSINSNLGKLYYEMGKFEKAENCFTKSLSIISNTSNYLWELKPTFEMIKLQITRGRREIAEKYLKRLEKIRNHVNSDMSHQMYNLGTAMILQTEKRIKQQSMAFDLYKSVIEGRLINFEMIKLSYLKQCEILLTELRLFYNEKIIFEIEEILGKLERIVREQKSFIYLIQIYLIQARFQVLLGNYEHGGEILRKAKEIANSNNMKNLLRALRNEERLINKEISKWKDIVENNSNLINRLEQTNLESYIDTLSKFIDNTGI